MNSIATISEALIKKGIMCCLDELLSKHTTFNIGGPCRCLIHCKKPEEVIYAQKMLLDHEMSYAFIGSGSNILAADEGIDRVVVRYENRDSAISMLPDGTIQVNGCTLLTDLVDYCIKEGLEGLEFCAGIPGTVGGAIAGNAGAFGRAVSDRLKHVRLLAINGDVGEYRAGELDFNYRNSSIAHEHAIVLSAVFSLNKADGHTLSSEYERIMAIRKQKHPDWHVVRTAGSFFKNVEGTSKADRRQAAGWYLEQIGAKQMHEGGAHTFDRHANIIVAEDGCTARDVLALAERMAAAVKDKFGIELEREVRVFRDT